MADEKTLGEQLTTALQECVTIDSVMKENDQLRKERDEYKKALEEISKSKYEGNPWTVIESTEAKIAREVLDKWKI